MTRCCGRCWSSCSSTGSLVVDLGVIDAVALRIHRSLGRARDVVAELDRDALGRRRRISRPLALAVLRRMGLDGDETDAED